MKLILSTSNIVRGGSAFRPIGASKSNLELVSSLRSNFEHHATDIVEQNGVSGVQYPAWTRYDALDKTLEVPRLDFSLSTLEEEREQYDITLKLFYLPGTSAQDRDAQTREAVRLVLEELHMPSVDLLIACFPGVYFDEEEDCPTKISTRGPVETAPEPLADQITTWKVLEELYTEGLVKRLGVAEFGHDRLQSFLAEATIKPGVDQINLRDCCSVPQDLMKLAKTQQVDLLVHNDCSNVLPRGTFRELLGPGGAGILAGNTQTGEKRKELHGEEPKTAGISGEVHPQWVVKYTAVVKNRGVVENKGYFAIAEVDD
ncbi:hypothetical protein AMS68_001320 [Peltaster fructicola]|uniref:GCS light chain n=1 Tax=Peltaster fructicola TaxID=286661 RepID=A0A6H0XM60_9PEZI|nr:hypothetical protein AMS68_001320 [Peltaster fructicola]